MTKIRITNTQVHLTGRWQESAFCCDLKSKQAFKTFLIKSATKQLEIKLNLKKSPTITTLYAIKVV